MLRLRTIFPDREFLVRSEGKVRHMKISSGVQIFVAAFVAVLLATLIVTIPTVAAVENAAEQERRLALAEREAAVASAAAQISRYRDDLDAAAKNLDRRQDFIESMVAAHIGDFPEDRQEAEHASEAAPAEKIGASLPEAKRFDRIDERQLSFVERLTRHADEQAERTADAIRKLGLNPGVMLSSVRDRQAEGGPYIALATSHDGTLDPRFKRLGASLARMDALKRSLAGVPQVQPASMQFVSSGFGYRSDPFNGQAAFHGGLDFRGPTGAPIFAAAKGVVSFAGVQGGYGNLIEVDHGNGLKTRYAHMSRFRARVGQTVEAGDVIGAIGSTGRSTGPHLHFEVRVHGRPVNPRPFLEAAQHVSQDSPASA